MNRFRKGFFSVSTKIVVLYSVILVAFAFAFFLVYLLSKQEIDRKQKLTNEELFLNHINYIDDAFRVLKNTAFELRNDNTIKQMKADSDSVDKFNLINSLSKTVNYFTYVDDIFLYNPAGQYFISAQGSIEAGVYFRSIYSDENLSGRWKELIQGKKDAFFNVTKYPEYEPVSRSDFYQRLLYIDTGISQNSELIVGFVIDVQKLFQSQNPKLNNLFVIGNSSGNALQAFLSDHWAYKSKPVFASSNDVSVVKIKENLVFYQSDKERGLIYLNVVNLEKYYKELGNNYIPILIIVSLLVLVITTCLWYLIKYNRNLKNIKCVLEDDFVNGILVKQPGAEFAHHVKEFLGLSRIKQIRVLMVSIVLKSPKALQQKQSCEEQINMLLATHSIRYRSFEWSRLRTIYIINDKSIRDLAGLMQALQLSLNDYKPLQELGVNLFVSEMFEGKDSMEKALEEVVELNEHFSVNTSGKVVFHEKDMQEYFYIPNQLKNQIRNAMALDEKQTLFQLIYELLKINIEHGISLKNWRVLIGKINSMLSEAIFEKFPEQYEASLVLIQQLTDASDELEPGYLICHYKPILFALSDTQQVNEAKESNKLQERFIQYIRDQYNKDIYLENMAEHFNLSAKYISSKFKEVMKESFTDYLNRYRITVAKELLRSTRYKINQISDLVGYSHVNVFIRQFKTLEGITPKSYREID